MRELTVRDVISLLPDEFIGAIGIYPGRRVRISKRNLLEAVRRMRLVGGYVWVPVPIKHRLALKGPYEFIVANMDVILYPDIICAEVGCNPSEADVTIVKTGKEALLLIDTEDVETYRKILEYLRDTSNCNVDIIEAPAMVRIEDLE